MRDLEHKLEKLEKVNITDSNLREEVSKLIREEKLHPIESTGILLKLGLVKAETIISLIVEGSRKQNNELEENNDNR